MQKQNVQQNRPTLQEFLKTTDPQTAKAQVEQMLAEGFPREKYDQIVQEAKMMARMMGFK